MPDSWTTDPDLIGLIDGLLASFNILAEVLVAAKIIDSENLAALLAEKAQEFREMRDPSLIAGAVVLERMARPLMDEKRRAARQLLNEPPQGVA